MESTYYFFGLRNDGKYLTLIDPITIRKNGYINTISANYFEEEYNIVYSNCGRGIVFCVGKDSKAIKKLLSSGIFPVAKYLHKDLSIYYLKDKKAILFKLTKTIKTYKSAKTHIFKILAPLKIITKKEFDSKTADWKKEKYSSFEDDAYLFETKNGNFSIHLDNLLYILVKPKKLKEFKDKVKSIYPKK